MKREQKVLNVPKQKIEKYGKKEKTPKKLIKISKKTKQKF